jgi:hypothetical protein
MMKSCNLHSVAALWKPYWQPSCFLLFDWSVVGAFAFLVPENLKVESKIMPVSCIQGNLFAFKENLVMLAVFPRWRPELILGIVELVICSLG